MTGRIGALARAYSACAQRALAGRTKQTGVIPLDRTSGSESVVPLVRGQRALDLRGKRRRLSPVWQPTIFCETAPIVQEVFSGFLLVFFCAAAFMRADQ